MSDTSHNGDGLLTEFLKQRLLLNMFVTCDEFGLLPKPEIKYELDVNYLQSLDYYDKISQNILFPNFYIDNETKGMTLLKNDILGITIILVDTDFGPELEFIGVKTIGDLILKYPKLLKSKAR